MPEPIVQTGVGFERETLRRLDRLRAVYGRSRSHLLERLVSEALASWETEVSDDLERFARLAAGAGMTLAEYTDAYVKAFGAKTFPPTVEQLEEMKFEQKRGTKSAPAAPAPVKRTGVRRAAGDARAAKVITPGARKALRDPEFREAIEQSPLLKALRQVRDEQPKVNQERLDAAPNRDNPPVPPASPGAPQ